MSKKRKREVDVELVKIYEELADESETVRVQAAYTLVSKIFKPGVTSDEQTRSILTRLFRGLCSSRKAARIGFSIALTELLSKVPIAAGADSDAAVSTASIVNLLEAQTAPEGNTSGQDERDHYFGRVFGAEAVLKSGVLFQGQDSSQWKHLLDLLCAIANKKPWLRQACGRALFNCISAANSQSVPEAFAIDTLLALSANKLIRTPEGVAIWIAVTKAFPNAPLPKSVWKHGDPLAKTDISTLATILKDARSQQDGTNEGFEAQGSASWSANLHFAWEVVLGELYQQTSSRKISASSSNATTSFKSFWDTVVEGSLFADSSSTERKAWGLSLWTRVFETAPQSLLQHTFTEQALRCLVNSLKAPDRYLRKCAQRVAQIFPTRFSGSDKTAPEQGLVGTCIRSLLQSAFFGDFDQITKSKTLQNILEIDHEQVQEAIFLTLDSLLKASVYYDEKTRAVQQKTIISLQGRLLATSLQIFEMASTTEQLSRPSRPVIPLTILKSWLYSVCVSQGIASNESERNAAQVALAAQVQNFLKDRLASGFEQALKLGKPGIHLLKDALFSIYQLEKQGVAMNIQFEDPIKVDVLTGWKKLSKLQTSEGPQVNSKNIRQATYSIQDGLALLYCLVLFQVYSGEAEAVEVLRETLSLEENWKPKKNKSLGPVSNDVPITQILLGFAARSSKFMRRITVQIFEAFAPQITRQGLESLWSILETKENVQGQEDMFEARDIEMDDGNEESLGSDVEEIDSDVEIASISSTSDTSGDSHETSSEGSEAESGAESSNDDEDSGEDEELAAFDAALASALGTRRLGQSDIAAASETSESDSDSDMDDDQMMELDAKLAEVFRARNAQQPKNKKRDAKDAKENIVNFKNRVLDLIDLYLKQQHQATVAIDLLLPLLKLVRTTQAKQLAIRAGDILRGFSSRCKGQVCPELRSKSDIEHAITILISIHEEACLQTSHAHSSLASLSSILVVKSVVKADPGKVRAVVDIYASTRMKQLTEKACHVAPGFFTDWNNWCQSMEKRLAK